MVIVLVYPISCERLWLLYALLGMVWCWATMDANCIHGYIFTKGKDKDVCIPKEPPIEYYYVDGRNKLGSCKELYPLIVVLFYIYTQYSTRNSYEETL